MEGMKKIFLIIIILNSSLILPASYWIHGAGYSTCDKFSLTAKLPLASPDTKQIMMEYSSWIQGFISALNMQYQSDVGEGMSWLELWYEVQEKCEKKPKQDVLDATLEVFFELKDQG